MTGGRPPQGKKGVQKRELRLRGATESFRNVQMLKVLRKDSRDSSDVGREFDWDTLVTPSDFPSWLGLVSCPILAPHASGTVLYCCQLPLPHPSRA